MDFVESIKHEGVDLEYQPMGPGTPPKSPLVVDVDRENSRKNLDELDIELPVLAPRIYREYKNLEAIDIEAMPKGQIPYQRFSAEDVLQLWLAVAGNLKRP